VALTALFVCGLLHGNHEGKQENKWGPYADAVGCPICAWPMPSFQRPDGLPQLLSGGWTRRHCGRRSDKWGRAIGVVSSRQ
jgi:hypothetical protein